MANIIVDSLLGCRERSCVANSMMLSMISLILLTVHIDFCDGINSVVVDHYFNQELISA